VLTLLLLGAAALLMAVPAAAGGETRAARPSTRSLDISPDRRCLVTPDGRPFFYLGDTAWELFHRLTREEADHYLRDRAAKGFTVIQAVVLAEFDGLHTPNAYGQVPLADDDPTRPNEAYFQHVDYIVGKAAELGLFVGMLPTWGDKVVDRMWVGGPEIFTPENARVYGEFLGKRYRDRPIIWILGGDRPADTEEKRAVWRAMAAGIKAGDGGRHLITYHPFGGHSSSVWLHGEQWLDFNMMQSGHGARHAPSYDMIARDRALEPVKPTLDGEPRYEDHSVNWKPDELGWFDERDVRQAVYWSLLAGGCGITYGCHDIWQFFDEGREPVTWARTPWKKALDLPGASQVGHARALYESRPFLQLGPDPSLIAAGQGEGMDHAVAARAHDGSFAFIYLPTGQPITIATTRLSGQRLRASWFDPRTGEWTPIGQSATADARQFTPPSSGWGNDWVLVLDDAARGYPVGPRPHSH